VEVAQAAEAAGWEALVIWDHLGYVWGVPSADPWVVLAAAAQATARLLLGTAVTPLPRRRPAVVAGAVTTLDRLSGGRVIFGAGLGGVAEEFTAFGERAAIGDRAAMLDEGLDVVTALWSGRPVRHAGRFYQVDGGDPGAAAGAAPEGAGVDRRGQSPDPPPGRPLGWLDHQLQ
jgi:alkanesulfonate monooxygenase SsuD/methylene tetrahydromethanopterin reductase-like flavin-dependent oxidoreductase (luciferase family)